MKTPLKHQIEDAAFLAQPGVHGNFSGMGSGKTLTSLHAIKTSNPMMTLIVAPPIALQMWKDEFEAYCGKPAVILKTGKTPLPLDGEARAMVCSYVIATKRRAELIERGFDVLVVDEAHACKNITAQRTKAILGKGGLAGAAASTHMLTGTPSPRWNDDVFGFLCRANPEGLKAKIGKLDEKRFKLRYCVVQKRTFPGARWPTELVVGNRNTDELNELIYGGDNPAAVRRELADVWKDMPEFTSTILPIKLRPSAEAKALLKQVGKMPMSQLQEELRTGRDPSLSTARRLIGEAKVISAATQIAEEIDSGAGGVLIGCWHTDVLDALLEDLSSRKREDGSPIRAAILDGRTSATEKKRIEDAFNASELDAVLGQIAAMGVSINLQHGGNRIIVVEEDWSPDIMDQFYARLYRMGQANHVHARILRGPTKIEEALARIAATKVREHGRLNKQVA